jgi:hypothetical protein
MVNNAIFKVIGFLLELIFYHSTIRIRDLHEVGKEMFHWFAWHFLFIFYLQYKPKCNMSFVGKAMIPLVPCRNKLILCIFSY